MLKGNKGEWSEVYVLFKILANGRIYAADSNLNRLDNVYFPVIKVVRRESLDTITEYLTGENVKVYVNGKVAMSIPKSIFGAESENLILSINSMNAKGAFSIENTENFLKSIGCYKLSASTNDKSDISMQIRDINTGFSPVVGFSIKSELGASPTLLNAGKTTNFSYKISHSCPNLMEVANEIYSVNRGVNHTDVRGRIRKIINENGTLNYNDMDNVAFKNNLQLIDSNMDKIVGESLLYYYRDGITNCEDIVSQLEVNNPMSLGNIYAYRYKFKKFLAAIALGMKPATEWNGFDEANGGYIIVTKAGDVLAYHIYNRNFFEEYLLKNTRYETASTTRHQFGEIINVDNEHFIKLNLQIRFK